MLNIVADENMPAVEHYLGRLARVTELHGRDICREHLLEADALLVRSVTRVDETLLSGTGVRFVGSATSGVDHIDRSWLASQGIGFAHAPGANANSVVEYVLAAISSVADYLERLFQGGTVGIVGFGHVGSALACRLEALGIAWRATDPWLAGDAIPHGANLSQVLSCDVVCLHPELTREQPWPSYHLLGADELSGLSENQLLINASRGPVIDSHALLSRLSRKNPPDVVLDVWEHEPQVEPELLARVRLGTAHIAGYSQDSKVLATRMLSDSLQTYLGLEHEPIPVAAGLEPVSIVAPGEVKPAALLRALVQQCYQVEQDDHLLRQSIADATQAHRAAAFDHLRKSYRQRRELSGTRVVVPNDSACIELVMALGCDPVLRGE